MTLDCRECGEPEERHLSPQGEWGVMCEPSTSDGYHSIATAQAQIMRDLRDRLAILVTDWNVRAGLAAEYDADVWRQAATELTERLES